MSADTSSSSESEGGGAAEASSSDGNVATIQLDMPRRSLQVTFRCNVCGEHVHSESEWCSRWGIGHKTKKSSEDLHVVLLGHGFV